MHFTKRLLMSSLTVFLFTTVLAPGCNKGTEVNPSNPPGQSNLSTPAYPNSPATGNTPSSTVNSTVQNVNWPWETNLSFPNGAPPLNQTAELICTVKNYHIPITDMHLQIGLPDAFELISGNFSWSGDIPTNSTINTIKANIKSLKPGNWTIDITGFIDPDKHQGFNGTNAWPIYVSVSQEKAEWRKFPPYNTPTAGPKFTSGPKTTSTPPISTAKNVVSPLTVDLNP